MKRLLDYGARAPKELMLFVKNMMFLNSATATLAPELDLIGEVMAVHTYFAQVHGERILAELGIDPSETVVEVDAVKAGFGVPADVERLTFRDLQERREVIRRRMESRARPRRRWVRKG